MESGERGVLGARRGSRRLTRRLTCVLIGVLLAVLVPVGVASAKSGSTPIPTPSPTQQVFSVSLAGQTYAYTWADITGTGLTDLLPVVTQSYLKDTDDQDPEEWTGVWLYNVLADVEQRSGIALADDWRLKVSTTDAYACGLFVGDVMDADNNFLLAQDPVRGCVYEDTSEATSESDWYEPSYVRVCRNGDYGNSAYPARLVSPTNSMTVLMLATAKLVVTSPTASQSRANVARRQHLALRAVATKAENAYGPEDVTWKSTRSAVASVSGSGTVTAKKVGTAVIKATSGSYTKSFTVKVVKKAVKARRVTVAKKKSLAVGAAVRLAPRLSPSKATTTVTWRSSNKRIATVDRAGRVTGVAKGAVRITVRTSNGKTAVCRVTVR